MEKRIRQIIKLFYPACISLILSIVFYLSGNVIPYNLLFIFSGVTILPFLAAQYIILLKHCKDCYQGPDKKLIFYLLLIEPAGPVHLMYFLRQIRPYMKQTNRYAYTEEIYYMKLKDLKTRAFYRDTETPKGYTSRLVPISEHPAYRYLETGGRDGFINYHKSGLRMKWRLKRKHPDPYSIKKFDRLYENIKTGGYKYSGNIIKVKGNIISDGMHRACMLYKLFGPEYEVGVILHKKTLNEIPG